MDNFTYEVNFTVRMDNFTYKVNFTIRRIASLARVGSIHLSVHPDYLAGGVGFLCVVDYKKGSVRAAVPKSNDRIRVIDDRSVSDDRCGFAEAVVIGSENRELDAVLLGVICREGVDAASASRNYFVAVGRQVLVEVYIVNFT